MRSYQTYVNGNQYLLKLSCPLMLYLMTMSMREGGGSSRVEMSVKHFTAMGFDCLIRVLYLLEICLKAEGIALQVSIRELFFPSSHPILQFFSYKFLS